MWAAEKDTFGMLGLRTRVQHHLYDMFSYIK